MKPRFHIPSPRLSPFLGRWACYCGVRSQVPLAPVSPVRLWSSRVQAPWSLRRGCPASDKSSPGKERATVGDLFVWEAQKLSLSASKIHGAHILQSRRKFLIPLTATNFITHNSGKLSLSHPLETFQPIYRYPAIPAVVLLKKDTTTPRFLGVRHLFALLAAASIPLSKGHCRSSFSHS